LDNNKLKTLQVEVGNLLSLKTIYFNFNFNRFKSIPKEIRKLENLEELRCEKTQIKIYQLKCQNLLL
jgi:Leucine-rich repeat (LRR) protein